MDGRTASKSIELLSHRVGDIQKRLANMPVTLAPPSDWAARIIQVHGAFRPNANTGKRVPGFYTAQSLEGSATTAGPHAFHQTLLTLVMPEGMDLSAAGGKDAYALLLNLAEDQSKTNILRDGTYHIAIKVGTYLYKQRGKPDQYWEVLATDVAIQSVIVRLDAYDTGGAGQYTGKILNGTFSGKSGQNFDTDVDHPNVPRGMIVGDDCLICNLDEIDLEGWRLKLGTYLVGRFINPSQPDTGITQEKDGSAIIFVHGGVGDETSPFVIVGSGATPDSSLDWKRNEDACALRLRIATRAYWDIVTDPAAPRLLQFRRDLTFDARGLLFEVSVEAYDVIDTPEPC